MLLESIWSFPQCPQPGSACAAPGCGHDPVHATGALTSFASACFAMPSRPAYVCPAAAPSRAFRLHTRDYASLGLAFGDAATAFRHFARTRRQAASVRA